MFSFFDDRVFREYENQLPERYDEEPIFNCCSCGDDIFEGEQIVVIDDNVYCCKCAVVKYAEREVDVID